MFRSLLVMTSLILLSSCGAKYFGQNQQSSRTPGPRTSSSGDQALDGVYRFVSRRTVITAPTQSTEELTEAEWFGIWVFHRGYFSHTRDKIDRTGWTPGHFPDSPEGIGFDGGSGTFSLHERTMELQYQTSFYPGRTGKLESLEFKLENDVLTLTEQLAPHIESIATGQRVTVLRKIQ